MSANLRHLLDQSKCAPPESVIPLSGGCINQCSQVKCDDGLTYVYKTLVNPPKGFFKAEAAGLDAIAQTQTIRTPAVIGVSESGLLLEYLPPSSPDKNYWHKLGELLASLHQSYAPCFGFDQDNFCGITPQPNAKTIDGHDFFSQQRLLYQADIALAAKLLSCADYRNIEALCSKLTELIPEQIPTVLHGDLWSGNIYCSQGEPVLLDPATHWGWAESEMAMTLLFGGFPNDFYQSYQQQVNLEHDWEDRSGIYNLYHLLNHLNIFGTSYLPQVKATIQRYMP